MEADVKLISTTITPAGTSGSTTPGSGRRPLTPFPFQPGILHTILEETDISMLFSWFRVWFPFWCATIIKAAGSSGSGSTSPASGPHSTFPTSGPHSTSPTSGSGPTPPTSGPHSTSPTSSDPDSMLFAWFRIWSPFCFWCAAIQIVADHELLEELSQFGIFAWMISWHFDSTLEYFETYSISTWLN